MVRRYEEPIEVQATADEHSASGVPDAFVWRGRLYVVREVLDHWQERRPWWRDALDAGGTAGAPRSTRGRDGGSTEQPRAGAIRAETSVLGGARERQVWRVEASAGRMAGSGVYDLGADLSPRQWRLLRVAD